MSLSRLRNVLKCDLVKASASSASISKLWGPCTKEVSTCSTQRGSVAQHSSKPDWNRAVSEAEKIVGYPTSFLSLRWVLSDEIANVALHLRKLVGSNHPLLKTAKYVLTLFLTNIMCHRHFFVVNLEISELHLHCHLLLNLFRKIVIPR